ncbi:hypothetical protein ORJ66_07960 [Pseudoalteromonas tunicata]|uniref:PKD domain-containing protein n=1 Tax=Pseudoalteromonas tunicata TaxID=314281 RepID=UPI00273E4BAC|nr:hypothetical protein [Pseudoalteromonas tunicata]MDP5212975.1 hypothetical protein [Pseudoalteromonas tunicata]
MIGNSLSFKAISITFCLFLLWGCGGGGSSSSASSELQKQPLPIISSLSLPSLIVGTNIEADVSYSSSVGNASIKTTIVSAPSESQMLNQEFSGSSFDITFDAVGNFTLNVAVSDSGGSVSKDFEFTTENNQPQASITGFNKSNLFTKYTLSGQGSSDGDNHSLTYSWSLITKPESSSLETDLGDSVDVQFYPDRKGEYTVNLTVSDGYGGENVTEFNFSVGAFKLRRLVFNVVDAVYSETLDKILIVGDDKKFYIYSPENHETQVISLNYQGNAVSVLPDGSKAAIGHNGNVSIIDISLLKVEKVYPISTDVFDIEIANNGYVYAMPRTDQWERLRAIKLENGEEVQQSGNSVRAGTVIKMHPSHKYIYGADRGLSPSDIEKYNISDGEPKYLYDSPYHGDYSMCGDLWMSQDGLRIFTKCGNVFRASEIRDQDMKYNGNIELEGRISALSHKGDNLVFVDDATPNFLNYYSYEVLGNAGSDELPFELVNDISFMTEAKFVFYRNDGSVISLVEIDSDSGYLFNYGLAFAPSEVENINTKPVAIVDANKYININEVVSISAESSFDPENVELTYSWQLVTKPDSSNTELLSYGEATTSFTPDVKGQYEIRVNVNDGVNDSSYATTVITAEDPLDKQLIDLDFEVLASVYSEQLNKVIMTTSNPSRLVLFDVNDNSTEEVLLENSSSVISLNPSGDIAALGFDNSVAIVDLVQLEVINTYEVSSNIIDLVLPDNGYLYVFPRTDQWERIRTINLLNGEEALSSGNYIRAGTKVTLHPSGDYIYGADNGSSPSDIELYDISGGNAKYVNDSPYHGDYSMCGNVWSSEDGDKLFTPCGNVFKANPEQNDDMQYSGKLNIAGRIKELSQKNEEIAVINEEAYWYSGSSEIGHVINLFEYPSLSFTRSIDIPTTIVNEVQYKNYGENVFHSSDGGKIIAIVKLDSEAGKLYEYSVFMYSK